MIDWPEFGQWAQVELLQGERIHGQLFHLDRTLNIAILMESMISEEYHALPAPLRPAIHHSVRIINLSAVKNVITGDKDTNICHALPIVGPIRIESLLRRERRALGKRRAELGGKAPVGATQEAMAIYSALAKT